MFGREERLYRVEITENIQYFDEKTIFGWIKAESFRKPFEFTKENGMLRYKPTEGIINQGIKGEVIKKWGKVYFSPDVDQEGIDLFTPIDNPYILVPYNKIKNQYKIID